MNSYPENDDDLEVIDFDDIIEFDDYDESNQPHQINQNLKLDPLKVIHNNDTIVTQSQEKQSKITEPINYSNKQTQKQDSNYIILRDVNMELGLNYFLTHPSPKGGIIQCRLYRAEPKFTLFLEQSNIILFAAEKKSFKLKSSYAIFDSGKKGHYIGKVKGDFMGSQFMIYDAGKTQKKSKTDAELRKEIGMIYYQPYKKTLREIQAYIPIIQSNGEMHQFKPKQQNQSMLQNLHNVIELINQKPQWIPKQKAYGLNFYGRVKESSVKNFILIEKGSEKPILVFGKTDNREYVLDFSYPLSPLQAFAIALSSIDHKFSCK